MQFRVLWYAVRGRAGRRVRWGGHPLALLLLLAIAFWLVLFGWSFAKLARDHYAAYEGTVMAIERHWTDHLVSESGDVEHLIVATPQGRTIDRYIGFETRVLNCIRVGDYVVKKRGFGHRVAPRDKPR